MLFLPNLKLMNNKMSNTEISKLIFHMDNDMPTYQLLSGKVITIMHRQLLNIENNPAQSVKNVFRNFMQSLDFDIE